MPLKNGNSVALERRMDLASLFCMIGRHGPAVALAVIAMVSLLAGFIIYRTVRGKKRRKATAAAGDGDEDGESPGAQRDASGASWPEQELSPGDPHSSSGESTDVSDEVSSGMKNGADLFHRDLNLRHRRAPAAGNKSPPPPPPSSSSSPPEGYVHIQDATVSDSETETDIQDSREEAEDATPNPWSDTTAVADATDDRVREEEEEDMEEVRGNEGCRRETGSIPDERHQEVEKVFEAEDDDSWTILEDVSGEKTSGEEEGPPSASNAEVCFVQDDEAAPETDGEEDDVNVPATQIQEESVCCVSYGRDEFEGDHFHPDVIGDSNYSSNHFSVEEERENEDEEAGEEFVDQQLKQEPNRPPSSQQERLLGSHWDNGVEGGEGAEEDVLEDHVLQADESGPQPPPGDHLSAVNTEAGAQISGVVDFLESSSDCQQPQREENQDGISKPLDEDPDRTVPGSEEPSLQKGLHYTGDQTAAADLQPSQDQEQQTGRLLDSEDVDDVTREPENIVPEEHTSPPPLPPFDLRSQDEDSASSPAAEAESGISSMTASPDSQDGGREFGDCPGDVSVSVPVGHTAGRVFGPYPSRVGQQPRSEHTGKAEHDSLADNEDMFGHEIEDSYHRALEQLMLEISSNATSTTEDLRKETAAVEVVEIREEKEDGRNTKKMATGAETEKEDDYEKTEISIMEATMDNNEWIMDGSYQVLPWMTTPPFPQNTARPPTDSSLTDTESSLSPEDGQTSSVSAVDGNIESNKKVVAVQPMPQNVNVTFHIHYLTRSPHQTVAVTGNQQELGNWKEFIPLERAKDGHWATVVSLPAESRVEWKFVLLEEGEVCRWEECGNRRLDTGYADELTVHELWGLL